MVAFGLAATLVAQAVLQLGLDVFADFAAAMRWVNQVAVLSERRNHHPDIDIRWNRVTLKLTTHETRGLTDRDWDWAEAAVLELG